MTTRLRPSEIWPKTSPASRCASRGGNGFLTVAATHAALLLAQGAGRLLRSMSDKGVVAVLDLPARLTPPFWTTYDPEVVRATLKRLDAAQTP